ncbi:hypothetical protein BJD46_gp69 [Mycobacterium phage Bactobuster]|uniref:Uncharacterized protein n=2 Tax=Pukovnikvirus TaxID=2948873 RepID=A0A127KPY2_9CAUD|nr:hypothetical protein BJD46_gp69 [Mycobacterium phage Bactobuster]YP_010064346.1 hypothetical protein KI248_gp27 [Mycobacterium phage Phaded]AMO44037.1 hypothetical protein SEA_BACTOBUSTER_69 [Mycobacterium phage Bactobuster]QGZ16872.1 hypothetical protein SEA_PHADED_72 [Mycobacterium phage Phaded]
MYVDDDDDLEELQSLLADAQDRLEQAREGSPAHEQAGWDIEDIEGRIDELSMQGKEVV